MTISSKGPSAEELFQREGGEVCLERWRRRRKRREEEEEGKSWEERLRENWENCRVSLQAFVHLCDVRDIQERRRGGEEGRE